MGFQICNYFILITNGSRGSALAHCKFCYRTHLSPNGWAYRTTKFGTERNAGRGVFSGSATTHAKGLLSPQNFGGPLLIPMFVVVVVTYSLTYLILRQRQYRHGCGRVVPLDRRRSRPQQRRCCPRTSAATRKAGRAARRLQGKRSDGGIAGYRLTHQTGSE